MENNGNLPFHVLITGGAGYIGSYTIPYFLQRGLRVTVLDSLIYGAESLIPFIDHPNFQFILGDIRNKSSLNKAMQGVDAVIHLAAIVGEEACMINKNLARSTNLDAVKDLLEIMSNLNIKKFIFLSTCSNYGISENDVLLDETSTLNPTSFYAETKVEAENYIFEKNTNTNKVILRFGTICGLAGRMRFDLLINDLARSIAMNQPVEIYEPNAWRPFLHIKDAAAALFCCLQNPIDPANATQVFNVVGENYQKKNLIDLILKFSPQAEIKIIESGKDIRNYRVSGELIRLKWGFQPKFKVLDAFMDIFNLVKQGIFSESDVSRFSALSPRLAAIR